MFRTERFVHLLAVVLAAVVLSCSTTQAPPREPSATEPVEQESGSGGDHHLYLVPGTYSNAEMWSSIERDKATFATELQRGLGDSWVLHPFLWRSSTSHSNRRAAAKRLARRIQLETSPRDTVSLVGFSHGGNVSLLAADVVDRPIDTLITLSTPHFYLVTRKNETKLRFPIYCSAGARKRIRRLISVRAAGDRVIETFAQFRLGISENRAIEMTRSWRKRAGSPRLTYDGNPLSDWAEDVLEIDISDNIVVRPSLIVADENIAYLSFVECGIRKHQRAHSRRMGYMLGQVLAGTRDAGYLKRYVQPASADTGEPVSREKHRKWIEEHRSEFRVSGWRLTSLHLRLERNKNDLDLNSLPDLIPRIQSGDETRWEGEVKKDTDRGTWQLKRYILPAGSQHELLLCDRDPLLQKENIGESGRTLTGTKESSPPTTFDPSENHPWSARLEWERIHH